VEATTRDIQIGEYRYQIGRFSARDGSWIVSQFLTRGLFMAFETPEEGKQLDEKELAGLLAVSLRSFNEEEFNLVRLKCFAVIRRYENKTGTEVAMPILMADGIRYAVVPPPDLVDTTVLLTAALSFNLHCFFAPGALEKLRAVFPSPQPTPGSTSTSPAQSQPVSGSTATSKR
jgi:hypothetical protein